MKKKAALLLVPAFALGMSAFAAAPAMAATGSTYQTTLDALNGSGASGSAMVTVSGDQATVHVEARGLAQTFNGSPYPHVQHIHINGMGMCPTPSADTDGDGVISTTEGHMAYGEIGTTLSASGATDASTALDVKVAGGSGGSFTYDRTFTLNAPTAASLKAGKAVIVVHGLDPAKLSKEAQAKKSDLTPDLPLAATSPALCGVVTASQMKMPNGGAATGGGSTSTGPDAGLLALGGGLVLTAGGILIARRQVAVSRNK